MQDIYIALSEFNNYRKKVIFIRNIVVVKVRAKDSYIVEDARFYTPSLSVGYTWAFFKVYANIYLKNLWVISYKNDQNLWRPSHGCDRD
jgi:hypothetical protein